MARKSENQKKEKEKEKKGNTRDKEEDLADNKEAPHISKKRMPDEQQRRIQPWKKNDSRISARRGCKINSGGECGPEEEQKSPRKMKKKGKRKNEKERKKTKNGIKSLYGLKTTNSIPGAIDCTLGFRLGFRV